MLTHSKLLYEDVRVTFEFIDNNDVVDDGYLSNICIEKLDEIPIFKSERYFIVGYFLQMTQRNLLDPCVSGRNYLTVLDNFRRFALIGVLKSIPN